MTAKWTVRRERFEDPHWPISIDWVVRGPDGRLFGSFVPTCAGHELALRFATECAALYEDGGQDR